jgi:hypothetical protein
MFGRDVVQKLWESALKVVTANSNFFFFEFTREAYRQSSSHSSLLIVLRIVVRIYILQPHAHTISYTTTHTWTPESGAVVVLVVLVVVRCSAELLKTTQSSMRFLARDLDANLLYTTHT